MGDTPKDLLVPDAYHAGLSQTQAKPQNKNPNDKDTKMKTIKRTAAAALLAVAACFQANDTSAQSLFGGWLTSGYGASQTTNLPPAFANANLTVGALVKGSGIGTVTTANVFGGNAWLNSTEAAAITAHDYIKWTVQANAGYTISFTTNILYYHVSSTGPASGELQYSTDGVNYTDVSSMPYPAGGGNGGATTVLTNNLSGVAALQNVPSGTVSYFRIVNWGATSAAGTWYVDDTAPGSLDDFQVIGKITSAGIAPSITGITPSPITAGYGGTVNITVTATGDPPSYFWYKGVPGSSTLIPTATNATLTLTSVTGANSGNYYVVLSNATPPTATSSVVSVSVLDPYITFPPNSVEGFQGGQAQFSVGAVGTSPSFAWYQNTGSGSWTLIANGMQPSGSSVSGQGTTNLIISNVQPDDATNFAEVEVIVSGLGSETSPAASLLNVSSDGPTLASYVMSGVEDPLGFQDGLPDSGVLAQWDFNGTNFINPLLNPAPYTGVYNPAAPALLFPPPWIGVGSATAVGTVFLPGTSPFNGALAAGEDGEGFTPNLPNGSFGTEDYPLTGGNKSNGVQFLTSTVGAKNIAVSYYLRETGTSSEYTRLQYTTNSGADWVDYPASSSFPGSDVNLYAPIYTYDLSGFPGVANNPEFGIRVVTEYQSTATYGIGSQGGNPLYITNGYVGADNLYSSGSVSNLYSAGTLTFDLVTIGGQPLNEAVYSPPTISDITNNNIISPVNTVTLNSVTNGESNYDYVRITNTFTIGSAITPVGELSVSAQSLNPNTVNGNFEFTASGNKVTMVITPNSIPDPIDAAPILVTVTDTATGDTTVESFLLTLESLNLPPTNSLTSLISTNILANSTVQIPFFIGSHDGTNTSPPVSFSLNSANNTVIPTGNLGLAGQGGTNLVVSITPAQNQLGQGVVSVTVDDGNPLEPLSTTATFPVMVRPNTNIILIDYFNYDSSGPLELVSAGYWGHLSGNEDQMQVENGLVPNSVTIDTLDTTETLQAPLLGAPYYVNSAASNTAPVLYASYIVTMADSSKLPVADGGYITTFNDGSGNTGTARVECGLWVQTNGAAPGHYRLGISDFPAQEGAGATFPMDLSVGTSYVVVTALTLSNGFSTLWVNPASQTSFHVQDTTTAVSAGGTNLNMSDFELHVGIGGDAGSASLSTLKVGTTFDSVFPALHIQSAPPNVVVNWSDPTLGIQSAPGVLGPWTDVVGAQPPYTNNTATNAVFFRFGE